MDYIQCFPIFVIQSSLTVKCKLNGLVTIWYSRIRFPRWRLIRLCLYLIFWNTLSFERALLLIVDISKIEVIHFALYFFLDIWIMRKPPKCMNILFFLRVIQLAAGFVLWYIAFLTSLVNWTCILISVKLQQMKLWCWFLYYYPCCCGWEIDLMNVSFIYQLTQVLILLALIRCYCMVSLFSEQTLIIIDSILKYRLKKQVVSLIIQILQTTAFIAAWRARWQWLYRLKLIFFLYFLD